MVPCLSAHGRGLCCAALGTEAFRGDHPTALAPQSPHSTEGLRVGVKVTPQHQDPSAHKPGPSCLSFHLLPS